MSLFDRVLDEGKKKKAAKAAGKTTGQFKDSSQDSYSHSDPSRHGRRNSAKPEVFKGSEGSRRYPVGNSYAGAMGSWRQALKRGGPTGAVRSAIHKKFPGVKLKGDDGYVDRDHGDGGPPEDKQTCHGKGCGEKPEHPGLERKPPRPWPFNHGGDKTWDPDWTALGFEKGSQARESSKREKRVKKGAKKAGKKVSKAVKGMKSALKGLKGGKP